MKKILTILLLVLVIGSAAGFGVYQHINGKTKFNTGYVNGNTAGNLYNAGLFCESGNTIFFANPSDENKLYAMDTNGEHVRKVSNDVASFINADANYIYYVRNNVSFDSAFSFLSINTDSLCRLDRDAKPKDRPIVLDRAPSMYASLIGNDIYYLHYDTTNNTQLYKVKIDGTQMEQISDNPYFTCCTDGQYLYYNGMKMDHNVWRFDTTTRSEELIYRDNCWMPTVIGSSIFFMDAENNYKLACVDSVTGEKMTLSDDRIEHYNIYGDYIYFQRNNDAALCRMRTDGSDYTVILEGDYTDINYAASNIYFRDFNTGLMFRTPLAYPEIAVPFEPGKGE